jgi:hypothetical protein
MFSRDENDDRAHADLTASVLRLALELVLLKQWDPSNTTFLGRLGVLNLK